MDEPIARAPAQESGRGVWRSNKGLGGKRRRRRAMEYLRGRDGDGCCFGAACLYGRPMDFETPRSEVPYLERWSIEHKLPWYRYRSHAMEHLGLAHIGCNEWHGRAMWKQRGYEGDLPRRIGLITGWPALTYADELEEDGRCAVFDAGWSGSGFGSASG